jgi:hypothetical protein
LEVSGKLFLEYIAKPVTTQILEIKTSFLQQTILMMPPEKLLLELKYYLKFSGISAFG